MGKTVIEQKKKKSKFSRISRLQFESSKTNIKMLK